MAKAGKGGSGRGGRKRRGTSEDMTGAKEGEVEVRKGELDLGEPIELSENDVHTHFKAIKKAMEQKDTYVSLLRGANKAASKLHPDLPAAIKEAITEERKNDPSKLKARLEVLGITLKASGSTIQLSVFDTLAGDEKELVYKRGYDDGVNGRTAANKYPEGSDLHERYATGWRHGTAKNLGLSPEEADAALEAEDGDDAAAADADHNSDEWPDDRQVREANGNGEEDDQVDAPRAREPVMTH